MVELHEMEHRRKTMEYLSAMIRIAAECRTMPTCIQAMIIAREKYRPFSSNMQQKTAKWHKPLEKYKFLCEKQRHSLQVLVFYQ